MTRRGWVLFIALGIIWGLPYMLIKVAVREVSPDLLVFFRTAGGALLLGPVVAYKAQWRGMLRHWKPLALYTLAEIAVPWLLLFHAEEKLPSSLSGLLIAAVPLVGAVLALATGSDRLGARRLTGLLLGFTGVAALVGFAVGHSDLVSAGSLLGVVVGYAVGPWILARHLSDLPPMAVVATSLTLAALVYAPLAAFSLPTHGLSAPVIESVVGLTVICTVVAFLVFFALIEEVGPMRATVITYINPAVAVLLGAVVLHERVGWATAVGFGLILLGCLFATTRSRDVPVAPTGAAAEVFAGTDTAGATSHLRPVTIPTVAEP